MSCSAAALCIAAYEGDVERARELLSHSEAPVNALADSGNVRGYTALTAACGFCSSTEIVDLLLARRADIDLVNHYGRSPLMSAVINQNCEIVAHLLRRGAEFELHHKNGMTALDYAHKAIAESRTAPQRAKAIEIEAALVAGRTHQRLRLLARRGRVEVIASHWRGLLRLLYAEVHYRPGGEGERHCQQHFEDCAHNGLREDDQIVYGCASAT